MARGDHLSVQRGWYTHHAIDLGDGYVVQYGRGVSDGASAAVQVSSYETFSKGRPMEVVAPLRPRMRRMRSRSGR